MLPLCRCLSAILFVGLLASAPLVADEPAKKADQPKPGDADQKAPLDQVELDKKFAEDMSGVVFAGSYSVTRGGKETPAEMEKYTITRVTKSKDDYWIFAARIQYGKRDITIPMSLQVKWAGDTPVITLTDLTIPGLGTFTSRVLIYGDRYAGTWQHGKTGGHLWGRIEKVEKPTDGEGPDGKAEKKKE
jgi:hypothetical protein